MDTFFFGFLFLFLLAFLLFLFFPRKKKLSARDQQLFLSHWNRIQGEPDLRQQLMQCDILLGKVMAALGIKGNVGAQLKSSPERFSDLNGIWNAHKIRNKIAHDLHFTLQDRDHSIAMRSYKRALKDLGIPLS